jgi:hypothetical protein
MASLQTQSNIILSDDSADYLVKDIECTRLSTEKGEMELRIKWNNRVAGVFLYVIPDSIPLDAEAIVHLPYAAEIVQSEYQREGRYAFSVKETGAVTILALPWFRDDNKKRVALQMQNGANMLRGVFGRKAKVAWRVLGQSGWLDKLRNKEQEIRVIIETSDPIPSGVLAIRFSRGVEVIDERIETKWDRTFVEPLKSSVIVCFASDSAGNSAKMFQLVREDN